MSPVGFAGTATGWLHPAGDGITEAESIAANNAWREYQPPVVVSTPLPLAGPTLVPFATMSTTALAGGTYELKLSLLVTGTNSGSQVETKIFIDAIDVLGVGPIFAFSVASGIENFATTLPFVLTPGAHVIELRAGQPVSPGTTTLIAATLLLERVI